MSSDQIKYFKKADGLRFVLQQRFDEAREEFPHGPRDFLSIYKNIESYLNENVHPNTVLGAAINGDGLLNDHGPDHVAMVVQRAGLILDGVEDQLIGYELFLLLLAIHFHDVGNVGGRDGHERRIFEIMESQGDHIPIENEEKEIVSKIAMVHGGHTDTGDKDTISKLNPSESVQGISIRPRVLAAILRFADEIADETSRANRYFKGESLLPKSRIYHEYSRVLQPANIKGDALLLKFKLPVGFVSEKLSKGSKEKIGEIEYIYLYDEILGRLGKCLNELEYCAKYAAGLIRINVISVNISVRKPKSLDDAFSDAFRMELSGYPNRGSDNVADLAKPGVRARSGEELQELLRQEDDE